MTRTSQFLLTTLLGLGLMATVTSCNKGPAEKAGEKIDNAVEDTKDAAKDLKDDIKKKL